MSNFLSVNVETQDEKNKITATCHLSEHALALEISETARKIFKTNPGLFLDISRSSKILGGTIYRQTTTVKHLGNNTLYTMANSVLDFNEDIVMQMTFENNDLQPKVRARTKKNTIFYYNPLRIKQSVEKGFLDKNDPSLSNILDSTIMTEVEQSLIFDEIKTFIIKDHLETTQNTIDVSYRVEIKIETFFDDMIIYLANNLNKYSLFLEKYSNSVMAPKNYDALYERFDDNFKNKILLSLGLENNRLNFSTNKVKSSDFGQAALFMMNTMLLLDANADKQVYNKFLQKVLPTSLSNPDSITSAINEYNSIVNIFYSEYSHILESSNARTVRTSNFSKKRQVNSISSKNYEPFVLSVEQVGYNIFDDNNSEEMTTTDYAMKTQSEKRKYYPDLISKDSFLSNFEKKKYESTKKASTYLTPSSLVYGPHSIDTSRGVANIEPKLVQDFRILKAALAGSKQSKAGSGKVTGNHTINLMNDFDFEITNTVPRLTERPIEGTIDQYIDSKHYMGENSLFVGPNEFANIEKSKKILAKIDKSNHKIIAEVIPNLFLKNDKSISSIKDLQISKGQSLTRKAIDNSLVDLEFVPPQIRSMMSEDFQPNKNFDPIQNVESREVLNETQLNIFSMKATVGFQKDENGIPNLNYPIVVDADEALRSNQPSFILKGDHYEESNLGIYKDKHLLTIYNNFKIVRRG